MRWLGIALSIALALVGLDWLLSHPVRYVFIGDEFRRREPIKRCRPF